MRWCAARDLSPWESCMFQTVYPCGDLQLATRPGSEYSAAALDLACAENFIREVGVMTPYSRLSGVVAVTQYNKAAGKARSCRPWTGSAGAHQVLPPAQLSSGYSAPT